MKSLYVLFNGLCVDESYENLKRLIVVHVVLDQTCG